MSGQYDHTKLNWDDARLFLMVARKGQMRAASDALNITQATLSRRMAALESNLGGALFVRHTSGTDLTEEGRLLFDDLERAEGPLLSGFARFETGQAQMRGTVRIAAPDGFAIGFLPTYLPEFYRLHPEITLEIVPLPRSFSLSKRDADLAVMVGRPETGRLTVQKLIRYSLGLYASQDYVAEFGLPETEEALKDHRLIGFVEDLIYSERLNYTQEFWRQWQSKLQIHSAIGQMQAVEAGAGIGVLHNYLANDRALVRILPNKNVRRYYWLISHENLQHIPRVQAVKSFLMQVVQEHAERFY